MSLLTYGVLVLDVLRTLFQLTQHQSSASCVRPPRPPPSPLPHVYPPPVIPPARRPPKLLSSTGWCCRIPPTFGTTPLRPTFLDLSQRRCASAADHDHDSPYSSQPILMAEPRPKRKTAMGQGRASGPSEYSHAWGPTIFCRWAAYWRESNYRLTTLRLFRQCPWALVRTSPGSMDPLPPGHPLKNYTGLRSNVSPAAQPQNEVRQSPTITKQRDESRKLPSAPHQIIDDRKLPSAPHEIVEDRKLPSAPALNTTSARSPPWINHTIPPCSRIPLALVNARRCYPTSRMTDYPLMQGQSLESPFPAVHQYHYRPQQHDLSIQQRSSASGTRTTHPNFSQNDGSDIMPVRQQRKTRKNPH